MEEGEFMEVDTPAATPATPAPPATPASTEPPQSSSSSKKRSRSHSPSRERDAKRSRGDDKAAKDDRKDDRKERKEGRSDRKDDRKDERKEDRKDERKDDRKDDRGDKDRDRERDRHKEHRDRERDRDRDRERDKERERDRERRDRDRDRPRDKPRDDKDKERDKDNKEREKDRSTTKGSEEAKAKETSSASATNEPEADPSKLRDLNVNEMNKLRAQLGLKPLREVQAPSQPANVKVEVRSAEALADERRLKRDKERELELEEKRNKAETLEDKLRAVKEAHKAKSKAARSRTLGDSDEEDESPAAWAARAQAAQEAKRAAEKATQLKAQLEAQEKAARANSDDSDSDEGFVPQQVRLAREEAKRMKGGANAAGRPGDVAGGLKLTYGLTDVAQLEADQKVFTLKDRQILAGTGDAMDLAEDEDELENVALAESEMRQKHADNKAGKGKYDPMAGEQSLLAQYDEEAAKKSYFIDDKGQVNAPDMKAEQELARAEAARAEARRLATVSGLETRSLAADFYSPEEMAVFKKRGAAKKAGGAGGNKRKRVGGLASELVDLPALQQHQREAAADLGSRAERLERQKQANVSEVVQALQKRENYQMAIKRAQREAGADADQGEEDDLNNVLQRARSAALKKRPEDFVAQQMEQNQTLGFKEEDKATLGSGPMLNATSEFVRSIPTQRSIAKDKEGDDDDDTLLALSEKLRKKKKEQQRLAARGKDEDDMDIEGGRIAASTASSKRGGWRDATDLIDANKEDDDAMDIDGPAITRRRSASPEPQRQQGQKPKTTASDVLGKEHVADKGVGSVLALLRKQVRSNSAERDKLSVGVLGRKTDELYDEADLQVSESVRLEYLDEKGRPLTRKQAFRELAQKFHNRYTGKKKKEQLLRERNDAVHRQEVVMGEDELATMQALHKKQEETALPYAVLGGNTAKIIEEHARARSRSPERSTMPVAKVKKERK